MTILLTVKSEIFKNIKNYVLSVKNWSMLYLFIYFNIDTNEELNDLYTSPNIVGWLTAQHLSITLV